MSVRSLRSALDIAGAIYRGQHGVAGVGLYVFRYLSRRGPQAVRRRIETRRSLSRMAAQPALAAGLTGIGVVTTGAVGDQIVVARFLRDLAACGGKLAFDVYVPDPLLGAWIYDGVDAVREVLQDSAFTATPRRYDARIEATGRLRLLPDAGGRGGAIPPSLAAVPVAADAGPGWENAFAHDMVYRHDRTRATVLHHLAGVPYGGDRYRLAVSDAATARFGLAGRRYVTVHNGFNPAEVTLGHASTKTYGGFAATIVLLRAQRPDLAFVQIGAATSLPIGGTDSNLLGRTTLAEAAALVRDAVCHVDNESGLVHIASCFGTPCCVVYGPTNPDYFSYAGNVGVRPVACGGCWAITEDWMSRCPRGMAAPVCTHSQPPSAVAAAVIRLLAVHRR